MSNPSDPAVDRPSGLSAAGLAPTVPDVDPADASIDLGRLGRLIGQIQAALAGRATTAP